MRRTPLLVTALLSTTLCAAVDAPPRPSFRHLSNVTVVRVMVQPSLHRPVNVMNRAESAIEGALEAGGVIVSRRGKKPPPEAGRVASQTFLFHVQTAVFPGSPGMVALAYQAELVEYTPYPNPANAGPNTPLYLMPLVLWHEAVAQLSPLSTDAQLTQAVEAAGAASASRCAKAIAEGRQQANSHH